ncbi:methyltransferase domain-containing protein [Planktothrix agardhii 1032]|uniref:glycosyltransferase n=2 Tax=Planktothrix agardhii TaxID=1160 RepID=UPI001D0BAC28|nr:glycosyltransferase [Planktothrix agardhii]MCB8777749.1 methyltransferase domain-containing protein [Planktothrix agardhii 1031]MCF3598739.1 methyltransferase domain-containing protein [Planktothrix agardhii 1032]
MKRPEALSLFPIHNIETIPSKIFPINKPIANLGAIYFISIQDKLMIIEGWLASFKQGQVEQFRLLIGGQEITDFDLTLGLPSPDVQESYPYLDHAETARFKMQLSWQEDPEQLHNCLIILTPLFQGKEGQILLTVFNPILPIPSEESINHIGGYGEWWFKQLAFQFLGYFIQRVGLKPTDSVLDVGCGVGRIAYGLTSYLKPPGRYEGFDVMESLIEWPKQEITSRFPHFNFYRVDLHNLMYNPTGIIKSINFAFPYADESFDFVFLTSVFTHLPPPEVRHYLSEIYRVLKPGGRCLCTCFILNEESEKLIDEGKSSQAIIHELEECFTKDLNVPEEAIGYKEHLLLKWIENSEFSVVDISYGGWCGRTEFSSGQDFLIIQKGESKMISSLKMPRILSSLDHAVIENDRLNLYGWVASFEEATVSSFKLSVANYNFSQFETIVGIDSPDVKSAYPQLYKADQARFSISIPLNSEQQEKLGYHYSLITLIPVFESKQGKPLQKLLAPTYIQDNIEPKLILNTGQMLPIPPEDLRVRVHGAADISSFLQVGLEINRDIRFALEKIGRNWSSFESILDFGCGCSRALIWNIAEDNSSHFFGSDVDPEVITWCQQNITVAQFNVNQVFPPLNYESNQFDFIYLISVFTHLDEAAQLSWLKEFDRILKPGSLVLITTHGKQVAQLLAPGLVNKLDSQGMIFDSDSITSSPLPEWYKNTYHTEAYIRQSWSTEFDIVDYIPGGMRNHQDIVILQKKVEASLESNQPKSQKTPTPCEGQSLNQTTSSQGLGAKPLLTPQQLEKLILEGKSSQALIYENEELEDQETNIISVPQQQASSLLAIETIPSEISHSQSLLKTIKANLERSLLQNQQVQQDLERSQREVQQRQYQRNLKTIFKTLKKQFPHHLNPVRDEYLLGLSGVTCEQFWKIIDPIIETQRPYLSHTSPTISILTPTWNSSLDWFLETVLSVLMQSRFDWEWCLVDDGSQQPEIKAILQGLAEKHPHIKVAFQESGGISSATNRALKMATGDYVCFLDHDDTLIPTALQDSLNQLAKGFDVVYSDEDKIDFSGLNYLEPFYKPDWSPEYFRGVMYAGHLLSVRRKLALEVGGLNSEFDGVQDYEFLLRLSEVTQNIGHLPKILYHWRKVRGSISGDVDAKAGIDTLQQAAVNSHLQRLGLLAQAEAGLGRHRVNINPHPKTDYPLISLIVATSKDSLEKSLHNFVAHSSYPNWEMIWVEPESSYPELQQNLQEFPVKKIAVSDPFKRSKAYNLGAKQAKGEYLVFLNPNTEAITEDWLRHLLYYAEQSDVGAVGGLLLSPERTVEQAGFILGKAGEIHTFMPDFQPNADGYAGSLICAREVAAVSCDCMMVKASTFDKIGGFNEYFFHQNYDSDFCLKIRQNHQRIIFTPRAVLINHQPMTGNDPTDKMLFLDQWYIDLESGDPYYNCNFNPDNFDYTILG